MACSLTKEEEQLAKLWQKKKKGELYCVKKENTPTRFFFFESSLDQPTVVKTTEKEIQHLVEKEFLAVKEKAFPSVLPFSGRTLCYYPSQKYETVMAETFAQKELFGIEEIINTLQTEMARAKTYQGMTSQEEIYHMFYNQFRVVSFLQEDGSLFLLLSNKDQEKESETSLELKKFFFYATTNDYFKTVSLPDYVTSLYKKAYEIIFLNKKRKS